MRCLRKSGVALAFTALISPSISVEGANPRTGKITVPVMTSLTVKLDQPLSAKAAGNAEGFTATIIEPVEVEGVTVIPVNSSAAGLVSKAAQGSGQIELNSVFVNRRSYRITTSPISFNQKASLRSGSIVTFHLVLSLNVAR